MSLKIALNMGARKSRNAYLEYEFLHIRNDATGIAQDTGLASALKSTENSRRP
jgi:hypothetical protein